MVAKRDFSKYCSRGEVVELDPRNPEAVGELFQEVSRRSRSTWRCTAWTAPSVMGRLPIKLFAGLVKAMRDGIIQWRRREWLGQDVIHVGSAFGKSKPAGTNSAQVTRNSREIGYEQGESVVQYTCGMCRVFGM